MKAYFEDLKFAMETIKAEAGDEMVGLVLEPDFIGYLAQNNQDPMTLSAQTGAVYDAGSARSLQRPGFPEHRAWPGRSHQLHDQQISPECLLRLAVQSLGLPAGGWTTPIGAKASSALPTSAA